MDNARKIEKSLIQLQIILFGITLLSHGLFDRGHQDLLWYVAAAVTGFFSCWVKYRMISQTAGSAPKVWIRIRMIDLFVMAVYLVVYSFQSVFAFLFPLAIVGSTWANEDNMDRLYLKLSLGVYTGSFLIYALQHKAAFIDVTHFLLNSALIYFFCSFIIKLLAERKDYLKQLTLANHRLNRKVAEFYTLQQLQLAIKSIHNTDELLKTVNDMIIGVVGPTFSSIVLDHPAIEPEQQSGFVLSATNMEAGKDDFLRNDCQMLWSSVDMGEGFIGTADSAGEIGFSDQRITSFIVVPLTIKEKRIGMIVVCHFIEAALNDEHLRLVRLVAGDLSIALENTGLYEEMEKMATLDGLTMVYNRMYFQSALDEQFKKAFNQYPLSIAICDADFFKSINDSYGHIFGDFVLKEIAERLQRNLRDQDIIARYGGEEFVIILPNCALNEAYTIVERLRESISKEPIEDKYHSVKVTVSFGVASYPEHGSTSRRVLNAADHALYTAKREGRNCTRTA